MVYLGFPSISGILFPYSHIYIRLVEITNMNSTWCKCTAKNINDKYEKKKTLDTLNHDHKVLGLDHDFSLAQQIHKSYIRGNQD